jgi:hypothetical protein
MQWKCNQLQPNPGTALRNLLKMVARDGIEPPTPAFSGPQSAIRISLIRFALAFVFALIMADILE